MNVLIDTCVIIDAVQHRQPFSILAEPILLGAAEHQFEGFWTAKSMLDCYYLVHHDTHSDAQTRGVLMNIALSLRGLDTTATDCQQALFSDMRDYEDAVMTATARRTGMDFIVTRNLKDYERSQVPAVSPADFLARLK